MCKMLEEKKSRTKKWFTFAPFFRVSFLSLPFQFWISLLKPSFFLCGGKKIVATHGSVKICVRKDKLSENMRLARKLRDLSNLFCALAECHHVSLCVQCRSKYLKVIQVLKRSEVTALFEIIRSIFNVNNIDPEF